MVLVDTPVWSAAFRKNSDSPLKDHLRRLILGRLAVLIGPIRQEILSGIREPKQFERLKVELSAFADHELLTKDFETAACFFNACRAKGVQGSNTDFLICSVAARSGFQVFTTDRDFLRFSQVLGVQLFAVK